MIHRFDPCPSCGVAMKWTIDYALGGDDEEYEVDVCEHCGYTDGDDAVAWRSNPGNHLVHAKVMEIEAALRDALNSSVIGEPSLEEEYDKIVACLNASTLAERLRFLAHIQGASYDEIRASVANVTYGANVEPHKDIPGLVDVTIKAHVRTKLDIEVIHVRGVVK